MQCTIYIYMVALANEQNTSAKHGHVKVSEYFLIPNFTASPLYEVFLGIICHSSLNFAIFTYIYEL